MTDFGENIRMAVEGLRANKIRAFLTMLGIIIGISSVIAIVSVGDALIGSVNDVFSKIGGNNIEVTVTSADADATLEMTDDLRIQDDTIEAFKARYPDIVKGVAVNAPGGTVTTTDQLKNSSISLTGVNPDYFNVQNIQVKKGRLLNEEDVSGARSVIVLSETGAEKFFGKSDPIGKTLSVTGSGGDRVYTVIGTYRVDNGILSDSYSNQQAYIPVSTAAEDSGTSGYSFILVLTAQGTDTAAFAVKAGDFFSQYLPENSGAKIQSTSMQNMIQEMNSQLGTVSTGVSVIAGISLLVGGIGVMNIMLVSVSERTREIGIRKALGARNGTIRTQFLVESMIICLIGGIIGILLGGGFALIAGKFIGITVFPSFGSVATAVGFSMLIGLFFGSYPAAKAAKMNPIDALRYE